MIKGEKKNKSYFFCFPTRGEGRQRQGRERGKRGQCLMTVPDESESEKRQKRVFFLFDQCSEQIALGRPHDMDVITLS